MPFAAALSEHPGAAPATGEVVGQVLEALGAEPDLAVLVVNDAHREALPQIAAAVRRLLRPGCLVGTGTAGLIEGAREVERHPAVALWAARFGPVEVHHVHTARAGAGAGAPGSARPTVIGIDARHLDAAAAALVVGGGPGIDAADLRAAVAATHPHLPVLGGLVHDHRSASAGSVVVDGAVHTSGAALVLLGPGQAPRSIVSHGFRAVGSPLVVTGADGPVVRAIAGVPALDRWQALAPTDQPGSGGDGAWSPGAPGSVRLGVVLDEHPADFGRDDFRLVEVVGFDHASRAVIVADPVAVGTTVQFHVRDAAGAAHDLRAALAGHDGDAALVFAGADRGLRLFGVPDHDAAIVSAAVGGAAVTGYFCAEPLGVGTSRSGAHRSAATVALFRDAP